MSHKYVCLYLPLSSAPEWPELSVQMLLPIQAVLAQEAPCWLYIAKLISVEQGWRKQKETTVLQCKLLLLIKFFCLTDLLMKPFFALYFRCSQSSDVFLQLGDILKPDEWIMQAIQIIPYQHYCNIVWHFIVRRCLLFHTVRLFPLCLGVLMQWYPAPCEFLHWFFFVLSS